MSTEILKRLCELEYDYITFAVMVSGLFDAIEEAGIDDATVSAYKHIAEKKMIEINSKIKRGKNERI